MYRMDPYFDAAEEPILNLADARNFQIAQTIEHLEHDLGETMDAHRGRLRESQLNHFEYEMTERELGVAIALMQAIAEAHCELASRFAS